MSLSRSEYLNYLKGSSCEGEDYIVSWFDKEGNEWFGEFTDLRSAFEIFNSICDNIVDLEQVACHIWSDIDNKSLVGYSNIENKYFYE